MDERDWYLALGLTPPEEKGAEEQEVAEPAPTEETQGMGSGESDETTVQETEADVEDAADVDEGEEEQEAAAPVEEESGEEKSPAGNAGPAQSKEERARQAAARREREKRDAVDAALKAERAKTDEELKKIFSWAGFKDGTVPIESLEQMRGYMERTEAARLEQDLKAGKLTPDALRQMIRSEMREPEAPPANTVDPAEFERRVQAELAEIRKYDPSIQSVEDFRNLDRREAFFAEVRDHGHSFAEAYKYVYADKIAERDAKKAEAAGAQRARNSARSKDHLRPDGAKGAGDVPVPPETVRYYKAMFPGITDEEIRKDYNKYAKQQK